MTISKILHMKDCGSSFHGKHLKSALEYITVPEKTQNGRLVSAINCQGDNAFEQMKETKKKFNKTDKRQCNKLYFKTWTLWCVYNNHIRNGEFLWLFFNTSVYSIVIQGECYYEKKNWYCYYVWINLY